MEEIKNQSTAQATEQVKEDKKVLNKEQTNNKFSINNNNRPNRDNNRDSNSREKAPRTSMTGYEEKVGRGRYR